MYALRISYWNKDTSPGTSSKLRLSSPTELEPLIVKIATHGRAHRVKYKSTCLSFIVTEHRAFVLDPMDSDMSCNLQTALSPSSNEVRRRSWACILAPVANSKRVHVYNAFRFDLVTLN